LVTNTDDVERPDRKNFPRTPTYQVEEVETRREKAARIVREQEAIWAPILAKAYEKRALAEEEEMKEEIKDEDKPIDRVPLRPGGVYALLVGRQRSETV
jgi:hypothetical protein